MMHLSWTIKKSVFIIILWYRIMSNLREEILKRMTEDIIRSNDKRAVYIVDGAPGSGKTTYVQKRKQPGDIIMDLDMIVSALQGDIISHPDYNPVMEIALSVRDTICEAIEKRQRAWNTAYIITSNPNKKAVEQLAGRLKGRVISMDTDVETCIQQIKNDSTRTEIQRDIELAREWYTKRFCK